jgi:hypothetical protein
MLKMNINVPEGIEHEGAYIDAAMARIRANANQTFRKNTPDAGVIEGFVRAGYLGDGQYADNFLGSLAKAIDTYGKLSPKQCDAVRKMIATKDVRKAEWASKQAALDAKRQHIGAIGDKVTLTLTLKKVISLDSNFGITGLFIFEDADQNTVIYKGNSSSVWELAEGQVIVLSATIKEHGVRNGVKQTVIQRPKQAA